MENSADTGRRPDMSFQPDPQLRLVRCSEGGQALAAVDIIAQAFANDPAMVKFVGEVQPTDALGRDIAKAIVFAHIKSGEPVYLLEHHTQGPVGAALVDVRRAWYAEILGVLRTWRLWQRLPGATVKAMNTYRALSRKGTDKRAHYLSMIGILPHAQDGGFGKQFIRMLEDDIGTTRGWSLDTENAANVPLYERIGYRLINTVQWDDASIFQMHKDASPVR